MDTKTKKVPRKVIREDRFIAVQIDPKHHAAIQAELGAGKRGIAQDGRIRVQVPAKFVKRLEKQMNSGQSLKLIINKAVDWLFENYSPSARVELYKLKAGALPTITAIVAAALDRWFAAAVQPVAVPPVTGA